jgi:hypothetical protein
MLPGMTVINAVTIKLKATLALAESSRTNTCVLDVSSA